MGDFSLGPAELERCTVWVKEHLDAKHKGKGKGKGKGKAPYAGAIGGLYSYVCTPTGLGTCVSVRCNACGAEKGLTDVSDLVATWRGLRAPGGMGQ